ncbi:hypothetical protein BDR26DRAFT_313549 [Obelidium mucronatum]|nr:hypothetical protein BDR26DRAFT_313549 [Obelidium mucronatum]
MTVCVDYDGRTWTSKSAPKRVLVAIVDLCNQLSITKVWMDSLGIDQSCDENGTSTERSKLDKMHFIPKMTQVFSKAEIVAGYADSNESDACTEWYDRVWILQEMVLAKTLMIFRGKWQTVTEEKRFWAKKVATETIQEERKNGRSSHPGLRILSDLGAACLGTCQGETKLSLAQIAHLTSHRQCFMPQDRVYGVLGLLPFRSNLVTDYQEPLEVVWRKVILEAIEHSMDLSVFLTRRSQYQTDASICLGAMEVPEIAHGLSIMTWAAKQVIHNDTQWGFNKFFPATTVSIHKLENGLNCTSSLTNYVKAMLFLLTAIPKIGDKMNPNIAAKLDWICSTFFILNRVQDDREWGWEVVIRCAEVGASSDQASSSLEKDGKQPPNSNSVTLLVPSKELALTVGQNVVLIPVGHQGSTQRGIICKKSEETAGSGALVPVCVFSCDRAQLKRFPVVKGDLFFH